MSESYYIVREEIYWDTNRRQIIRRVVESGVPDPDFWEFLGLVDIEFDGASFTLRFPIPIDHGVPGSDDGVKKAFAAFDAEASKAKDSALHAMSEKATQRAKSSAKSVLTGPGHNALLPEIHLNEDGSIGCRKD